MLQGPEYCFSDTKNALDKSIALGLLPPSSPLWLTMYLYNKCRRQPLLFKQQRIGRNLDPFTIYKFETLHAGDEQSQEHNIRLNTPSQEREKNDPRIPNHFMAFLRCTGLNEIPQLINILQGNLSIVGPRPIGKDYLIEAEANFPRIVNEWKMTAATIKPGIVGTNPLKTRRTPVIEFYKQAESDIKYYQTANFWLDLQIIGQAMISMARG